jgi:hypothetical protein
MTQDMYRRDFVARTAAAGAALAATLLAVDALRSHRDYLKEHPARRSEEQVPLDR